jgi:DNA repair protein RadC
MKNFYFHFEEFKPFLKKGLAEKITKYDYRNLKQVLLLPTLSEQEKGFINTLKSFSEAYTKNKFIGKKFNASSQADIIAHFKNVAYDLKRETVHAIFLNAKNKIFDNMLLCEGTITQSILYVREIIKACIDKGALSIVIIHNHPSGDPAPSENDRKVTRKLLFATKEVDITLLDHIIIGQEGKGYFSFYEEGLMERYNGTYRSLLENQEL